MEKKARIARARADEEDHNLLAERRRHDLLSLQVSNAQLQLRPAPKPLQDRTGLAFLAAC